MTDRRRARITLEMIGSILKVPGRVTHVQTNHATGIVEIYFEGTGQHQVAEGMESVVRTIEDWNEHDQKFEEELIDQWESD